MMCFYAMRLQISITAIIQKVLSIGTSQFVPEMQELHSNPIGLDRFSVEEKIHIELLIVLNKEFRAPMNAFSHIREGKFVVSK